MKFIIATSIQALFALIGLGLMLYSNFESNLSLVISVVLFVLIPALGAYGTHYRKRGAIMISIVFFVSQSYRSINADNIIPNIAPITISFPFGDFSTGQGYLIDFFAIFMAIFLAYLFKVVVTPNKRIKLQTHNS